MNPFLMNLEIVITFIIFLLGVYNLAMAKNLIKSIISLGILDTSLVMLFIKMSSKSGTSIPIIGESVWTAPMADPMPQAIMITAIVINAAITALGLMMSIKLFHFHGSLEWSDIFERKD